MTDKAATSKTEIKQTSD